jgi:toxin ParE1/3/4
MLINYAWPKLINISRLFFEYFDIIAKRPFSFEPVDFIKSGYRRCVSGADSIYYKINNDKVEIMAIIGRKDLDNLL